MAQYVQEIMNPELFSVRDGEEAGEITSYLLALGISSAPVLDDEHRPVGFVSFRDLISAPDEATVAQVMSSPVDVVPADATIDVAAELLAGQDRHHTVAVDGEGRAVGFVSVMDVMRAMLGHPFRHPSGFPHCDGVTGLTWTDPQILEETTITMVEGGPGLYMLVLSQPGQRDRVVWSEASADVRTRLFDILLTPKVAPPHIAIYIGKPELVFRVARAPSSRALLERLRRVS